MSLEGWQLVEPIRGRRRFIAYLETPCPAMSIPDRRQERVLGAELQALHLESAALSVHLERVSACCLCSPCTSGLAAKQELYIFLAVEVWLPGDAAGLASTDTSRIQTSNVPTFSRITEGKLPSL